MNLTTLFLTLCLCHLATRADGKRKARQSTDPVVRYYKRKTECVRWQHSSNVTKTQMFMDSRCKNPETATQKEKRLRSVGLAKSSAPPKHKRRIPKSSATGRSPQRKLKQHTVESSRKKSSATRKPKTGTTKSSRTKSSSRRKPKRPTTKSSRTKSGSRRKPKRPTTKSSRTKSSASRKAKKSTTKSSTIKSQSNGRSTTKSLQTTTRTPTTIPSTRSTPTTTKLSTKKLSVEQFHLFCIRKKGFWSEEVGRYGKVCSKSTKEDCEQYPKGMCSTTTNRTEVEETTRERFDPVEHFLVGEKNEMYQVVNDCKGVTSCFICVKDLEDCIRDSHPDYELEYNEREPRLKPEIVKSDSTGKVAVACLNYFTNKDKFCFVVSDNDCSHKYGKNYCQKRIKGEAEDVVRIHRGNNVFASWQLIGQEKEGAPYKKSSIVREYA